MPQPPWRQFSLRGFLGFVLVCSVWCAQLSSFWLVFGPAKQRDLRGAAAVAVAWLVLAACYWLTKRWELLAVHGWIPLLGLNASLPALATPSHPQADPLAPLVATLFAANLITFPVWLLLLFSRLRHRL